jgi:tRNA-dihydrouridine synthase
MAITYENNEATFVGVIYEDEVVSFRDFLQEKAGEEISMKFQECDDIHLAVIQLIMAYKKNYKCNYTFGEEKKLFQKVLEGFEVSENYCS